MSQYKTDTPVLNLSVTRYLPVKVQYPYNDEPSLLSILIFCLYTHLPPPWSKKPVMQLYWGGCITLFLSYPLNFPFFVHTTPSALSTGELLFILLDSPQGTLDQSPSALFKWVRHLFCVSHITNINPFSLNNLYLSAYPLHEVPLRKIHFIFESPRPTTV